MASGNLETRGWVVPPPPEQWSTYGLSGNGHKNPTHETHTANGNGASEGGIALDGMAKFIVPEHSRLIMGDVPTKQMPKDAWDEHQAELATDEGTGYPPDPKPNGNCTRPSPMPEINLSTYPNDTARRPYRGHDDTERNQRARRNGHSSPR